MVTSVEVAEVEDTIEETVEVNKGTRGKRSVDHPWNTSTAL